MKRYVPLFLVLTLLLYQPVPAQANFPVDGTYLSLRTGTAESYDRFDDQMVIVEAFATWCIPCKNEMHELSILQDKFRDNITLFSLSVSQGSDNLQKVETFKLNAEQEFDFNADWEFGIQYDDPLFSTVMDIEVIPTTFLINPDGDVVNRWEGITNASAIGSYIDANVTFPESNQAELLWRQISQNSAFRIFSLLIVLYGAYRLLLPSRTEQQDSPEDV